MGRHVPATVDATGAKRRVEALMTLGYDTHQIAAGIGLARNNVSRLLNNHRTEVRRETHEAIVRFYDQAWQTPSTHRYIKRTKALAAKRGYVPPMGWDDDSIDDPLAEPFTETAVGIDWQIVERAVAGKLRGRRLSSAEREAAMQVMAQRGVTATGISRALGVHTADARRVAQEAVA